MGDPAGPLPAQAITPPVAQPTPYGLRPDGTVKGQGFLGPFDLGKNGVASEYSIADSEQLKDAKGHYIDYPTLVPTLTRDEVLAVLAAAKAGKRVPSSVAQKAEAFALQRRAQGKPLFAQPGEQLMDLYPDIPRHRDVESVSAY